MIKHVGQSKTLACARYYAEKSGKPWFIIGGTGWVTDSQVEQHRWRVVPRLEYRPDGSIVIHKAEPIQKEFD